LWFDAFLCYSQSETFTTRFKNMTTMCQTIQNSTRQPGTGKTHLATALGISACQRGKNVKFYRVSKRNDGGKKTAAEASASGALRRKVLAERQAAENQT
jgi:hypothetical protein